MVVRIFLNGDPDKQGYDKLMFRVYLNGKPFKIYSKIKAPKEAYSNDTIKRVPGFPMGDKLNTLLQLRKSVLQESEDAAKISGQQLTPDFVRRYYKSKVEKTEDPKPANDRMDFFSFVDWFVEKYTGIKKYNYLRQFFQPKDHIREFQPDMAWEDFTEDFWVDYVRHLIGKGLKNITIHGHLKKLHTLMEKAIAKGYPVPDEFMEIRFTTEEKQPFWCTWEEVEKIKTAYCRTPAEEVIRDSFVISANLGIRNSDFNMINKHSIYFNNGKPMLRLTVVKTQLDYSLPINKEVWGILQKYDMNIPKYHQATYNEYIKIIARRVIDNTMYREVDHSGSKRIETLVPRYKKFSTHTARRTFGRRWLDRGGSLIILQKVFGHRSPETTLKYIGYSSFEIEQEFAKVMEA